MQHCAMHPSGVLSGQNGLVWCALRGPVYGPVCMRVVCVLRMGRCVCVRVCVFCVWVGVYACVCVFCVWAGVYACECVFCVWAGVYACACVFSVRSMCLRVRVCLFCGMLLNGPTLRPVAKPCGCMHQRNRQRATKRVKCSGLCCLGILFSVVHLTLTA